MSYNFCHDNYITYHDIVSNF